MNFVEAFSLLTTPRVAISFFSFFLISFFVLMYHTQISLYLNITYIVNHYKSY